MNGDFRKLKSSYESGFEDVYAGCVYDWYRSTSGVHMPRLSIKGRYFLGAHFLARYLKLRCLFDCNQLSNEAIDAFTAKSSKLPFEHIICGFLRKKLRRIYE